MNPNLNFVFSGGGRGGGLKGARASVFLTQNPNLKNSFFFFFFFWGGGVGRGHERDVGGGLMDAQTDRPQTNWPLHLLRS